MPEEKNQATKVMNGDRLKVVGACNVVAGAAFVLYGLLPYKSLGAGAVGLKMAMLRVQ